MPTCNSKKSSIPFHSNYWENCHYDRGYEASYRFNKEQFYDGEFFRDGFHGWGTYKWEDVAVYEGYFYSNFKEGYASLSLPDNSNFEGLFIRNEPFGPGILTYANGRQDAGFWMGRKLVRLSRAVDFIIPRLAPTSAAKIKLLQFKRLIPLNETYWDFNTDVLKKCGYPFEHFYSPYSSLIYDPRSIFFDTQAFEKTYFVNIKEVLKEFVDGQKNWECITDSREGSKEGNSVLRRGPCLQNVLLTDRDNQDTSDICDRRSSDGGEYELGFLGYFTKFGTLEGLEKSKEEGECESDFLGENMSVWGEEEEHTKSKSRPPNIVSWNRSEFCTEMLKQIFRYRAFEEKLTFDLAQLMLGVRTAFRRTGVREKQCLQFLKMCSIGPAHVVRDLLCSHEISEELMDARGNNSLMFAAATDQHEIMDILLDYGVDVNSFNDENLTPLNLSLLRRLAHAKGISSWETAFLPKEIDVPPDEYQEPQGLEAQLSISSLDRKFGDGMSLADSKSRIFDSRYLTPFPSPTMMKESNEMSQQQPNRFSDESRDMSDLSQITILNINKSPGCHALVYPPCEEDPRTQFSARRSSSISGIREASQPLGSNEETPRIVINMVPKSNKRDEFVRSIVKSNTDKYLFEFTFDENPAVVESKKVESLVKRNKKGSKPVKEEKVEEREEEDGEAEPKGVEELVDFELTKKIAQIDKTIQKLLRRGADPNICEVPQPAIHLGVYTKDSNTVYNLLLYGANPSSQLYSNEGLLTPLHVVVLQSSSRELVDICQLLLNFGAEPDKKTHPEFSIHEGEKGFLVPEQGRTPLQLLCMRPDLEYSDPEENLIKIALMLGAECDRKCLYNGHTCLTLTMFFGNLKLLEALLKSQLFDPNEDLGKNRGTALHVLVSTELQKKTSFDKSIKMCDLLLQAGANPLKKFRHPRSLRGTCVDYGYREIEKEREARRSIGAVKKVTTKPEKSGKEKSLGRDYLEDHQKVVEYLGEKTHSLAGKKTFGIHKRLDSLSQSLRDRHASEDSDEDRGKEGQDGEKKDGERDDRGKGKQNDIKDEQDGKDKKGDTDLEKGKKGKGGDEEDKAELEKRQKKKAGEEEGKGKEGKKRKGDDEGGENPDKKDKVDFEGDRKKGKETQAGDRRKGTKGSENDKTAKPSKSSFKHPSTKQLGACSETFPERLRQNLLQKYGNCAYLDINEFLVPYVVLRDGDLYYRFHGKIPGHKEQYSLI